MADIEISVAMCFSNQSAIGRRCDIEYNIAGSNLELVEIDKFFKTSSEQISKVAEEYRKTGENNVQ